MNDYSNFVYHYLMIDDNILVSLDMVIQLSVYRSESVELLPFIDIY